MRFDAQLAEIRFGTGLGRRARLAGDVGAFLARLGTPDHAAQAFPIESFIAQVPDIARFRALGKAARRGNPGPEVILGRSYGGARPRIGDVWQALGDLALHPATARHIARKLVVHFVSDSPDEAHIAHVAARFCRVAAR